MPTAVDGLVSRGLVKYTGCATTFSFQLLSSKPPLSIADTKWDMTIYIPQQSWHASCEEQPRNASLISKIELNEAKGRG